LGLFSVILFASCSYNAGSPAVESKTLELTVTLPGKNSTTILVNEQGSLVNSTQITSSDGNIGLTIDKGTTLLNKEGKPLQSIIVVIDPLKPIPPENAEIVGPIVDIQPQGAIAKPSLKFTLNYVPSALPQGFNDNDLWIYEYTGTIWKMVTYRLGNPEANTITTTISRFGKYGVFASAKPVETTTPLSTQSLTSITFPQALTNGKPTLAEFGRGTCIPCKQMKPILENLAVQYKDKLNVSIVSVDDYSELTNYYKVMAIPTQIGFDGNGKEVFRHVGFWAKDQIITQLGKMGIN
jgi:thioredoxin 1